MAGAAVARAVSSQPAGRIWRSEAYGVASGTSSKFVFRLAARADDSSLRRLLRENPFDGAIRLSLECEPDALAAAAIHGPLHQMLVAEDRQSGRIVAMACRAERDLFVNGRKQRLGYLGQLRVDRSARGRRGLLTGGFAFCRTLHAAGSVPAYLVSIIDDNRPARRLLAGARLPGFPALTPLEPFVTFAVPTRQGLAWASRENRQGRIERGRGELVRSLVECLQQYGARHQAAPVWTAGDLCSPAGTPGLQIDDFFVVLDSGRVTACVACWDQRAFKQAVVRGYSPWLARGRGLINLTAPMTGLPHLPPPGRPLHCAFLSHLAVDDPQQAVELVRAALARARAGGLTYLVLGLAARHPVAPVIARRFRHRQYVSQLYLAHWPDGDDFVRTLDSRIPHPEVALL